MSKISEANFMKGIAEGSRKLDRYLREGKRMPEGRRNTQPVMCMTTLQLRRAVEKVARKEHVSLSEIGRRALAQYVEKSAEERAPE